MKKKKILLFVGILSLIIFSLLFWGIKNVKKNVNYYRPIIIQVKGVHYDELSKMNCFSYSLLNKKNKLNPSKRFSGFDETYGYRRDLVLQIPIILASKIENVTIYYNDQKVILNKEDIIKLNTINDKQFLTLPLSKFVPFDEFGAKMIFSVILWGGFARKIYFAVIFIFGLLISMFVYIKHKKAIIETIIFVFLVFLKLIRVIVSSRKNRLLTSMGLVIAYSIIFFSTIKYSNTASFSMPEFVYHSCGVNMAKGDGVSRIGGIHDFEAYKFGEYGPNVEYNYKLHTRLKGLFFAFFPPAYGIFLGGVYGTFGVNPIIVKYIQLFLLILIAAFIPNLGFKLWKDNGFIAGLFASFFFIFKYYETAQFIQPNVILIFSTFLFFSSLIFYFQKQSIFWVATLGVITAFSLLVKIVIILFIGVFVVFLIYKTVKLKDSKYMMHSFIYLFFVLITILPWSIIASQKSREILLSSDEIIKLINVDVLTDKDEMFLEPLRINYPEKFNTKVYNNSDEGLYMRQDSFNIIFIEKTSQSFAKQDYVFISNQFNENHLLAVHNEYITKGGFNSDWICDPKSFYNSDNLKESSPIIRILNFYLHYPLKIIQLPVIKIHFGFSDFKWLIIGVICSVLCNLIIFFQKKQFLKQHMKYLLPIIINAGLVFVYFSAISLLTFSIFIIFIVTVFLIFKILKIEFEFISMEILLPVLSILLLGVLGSVLPRQVEVFDFIYFLIGLYYFFKLNILFFNSSSYKFH